MWKTPIRRRDALLARVHELLELRPRPCDLGLYSVPKNLAQYNCYDAYNDYARALDLDSVASAIEGGWIGIPYGNTGTNGLYCGGGIGPQSGSTYNPVTSMFQFPVGHSAPDIVDVHDYPCVAPGGCATTDSEAQVASEPSWGIRGKMNAIPG